MVLATSSTADASFSQHRPNGQQVNLRETLRQSASGGDGAVADILADAAPGSAELQPPPNCHPDGDTTCPSYLGVTYNVLTGQLQVAGCKRWTCYPCGKRRAKELFHRLAGYRFRRLVTLTAPASTRATRSSVSKLNYAWKLFHQWLLRRPELDGKRFDYLWGNESGNRTGQLHKHAAMPWFWFDYNQARAFIKERLAKRGLSGYVVDFGKKRPLRHARAVGYTLSYVTKDLGEMPRYARRVQTSVRRPQDKQPGWLFLPRWSDEVIPPWMADATTAEAIGIARSWMADLALIQEEKQHAAFCDSAVAGKEDVK